MKKKYVFLLLLVSIGFLSCSRQDSKNCETCESPDYLLKKVNISGTSHSLKTFIGVKENFDFAYEEIGDFRTFEDLLSQLEEKGMSVIDISKIQKLTFYSKKTVDANDYDIDDFYAILFYMKDENGNLYIKLFDISSSVTENKLSNLKTNIIYSNDINKIGQILGDNQHFISLNFDGKNLKYKRRGKTDLQVELGKVIIKNPSTSRQETCGSPCNDNDDMGCYLKEDGKYTCQSECGREDTKNELTESNAYRYNDSQIDPPLYNFRDTYLTTTPGGTNWINDYYYLSQEFPHNTMPISLLTQTMDLIVNNIIPMSNSLRANPNLTTNILYNTATKNILVNYLTSVKSYYTDATAKSKIDHLISKVGEFANKNNYYITTHLY